MLYLNLDLYRSRCLGEREKEGRIGGNEAEKRSFFFVGTSVLFCPAKTSQESARFVGTLLPSQKQFVCVHADDKKGRKNRHFDVTSKVKLLFPARCLFITTLRRPSSPLPAALP
jgi:hypothetical protein